MPCGGISSRFRKTTVLAGGADAALHADNWPTPTDIEWAFAGGTLYLLQARPITTYVLLPPELVTAPGQRRRLYQDAALADGLTINGPISPMGLAWMDDLTSSIFEHLLGQRVPIDAVATCST